MNKMMDKNAEKKIKRIGNAALSKPKTFSELRVRSKEKDKNTSAKNVMVCPVKLMTFWRCLIMKEMHYARAFAMGIFYLFLRVSSDKALFCDSV